MFQNITNQSLKLKIKKKRQIHISQLNPVTLLRMKEGFIFHVAELSKTVKQESKPILSATKPVYWN